MRASVVARSRVALLVALASAVVAACSAFTPTTEPATPTDFAGIVAELQNVGIEVDRVVSGDAGCDDQRLSRTAIGFDARGVDQPTPVRIYLYAFKDQQVYDELLPAVDACARSYVKNAADYGSVDAPPYVLAGGGPWTAAFKAALGNALRRAAVGG